VTGCIATLILRKETGEGPSWFLSLNMAGGTDTSDHGMARSLERAGYNGEETRATLAEARVVAETG
jgi:hypothetical protein